MERRRYWNPRVRGILAAYAILLVVVFAAALAAAGRHASWSTAAPWIALFPVAVVALTFGVLRAGVSESEVGLSSRPGGYRSTTFVWDHIEGFEYSRRRGAEVIVVRRVDGSQTELRGAGRRMRWHGGVTDDFAALLNERRRHFDVSPTVGPSPSQYAAP